MPAKIRKLPRKNRYEVIDSKGHKHAKNTTRRKAQAQARIINSARKNK